MKLNKRIIDMNRVLLIAATMLIPTLCFANGLQNIEKDADVLEGVLRGIITEDMCRDELKSSGIEALLSYKKSNTHEMIDQWSETMDSDMEDTVETVVSDMEELPPAMRCLLAYGFIHGVIAAESANN